MKSICWLALICLAFLEFGCGHSQDTIQMQKGISQVKAWRLDYSNSIDPVQQSASESRPARRPGRAERLMSFCDYTADVLTSQFSIRVTKEESAGSGLISIKSVELPDGTVKYLDVTISGVNNERLTKTRIWLDSQVSSQIDLDVQSRKLSFNQALAKVVASKIAEILSGDQLTAL